MQAWVTATRASVGSTKPASGTVSMRTSPAPCKTVARMVSPLCPLFVACHEPTQPRVVHVREIELIGVPPGTPTWNGDASSLEAVNTGSEIREFLTSRRARITPQRAGLPAGDPGQTIFAYTAEPNSPSHDALNLLASWTSNEQVASVDIDQ